MASLKEVKNRINSVQSTLKITSAMKVVASAKLHRTEQAVASLERYVRELHAIVSTLGDKVGHGAIVSPLAEVHAVQHTAAVIAISSNSSLCGAFNSNAARELDATMQELTDEGYVDIIVYTIGDKISRAAQKRGYNINNYFSSIATNPDVQDISQFARRLAARYVSGRLDKVVFVGNRFYSVGRQTPEHHTILPFRFSVEGDAAPDRESDYIVEPDAQTLVEEMVPAIFRTSLYAMILNAETAEHAARTVAMQTASDNANTLLDELRISYNKRRQKAITDELADITQASNA